MQKVNFMYVLRYIYLYRFQLEMAVSFIGSHFQLTIKVGLCIQLNCGTFKTIYSFSSICSNCPAFILSI